MTFTEPSKTYYLDKQSDEQINYTISSITLYDDGTLYVCPYVNLIPDFAEDGTIDVKYKNDPLREITSIVLGSTYSAARA